MKQLILNMPVKNYSDIMNSDESLKKDFTPGSVVKGTLKEKVIKMMGNSYSKMAAAAQRAMEIPPLCEMFMHEMFQDEHIGECVDNNQAVRLALILNNLYLARPEFTINTEPIISEVSDEDFNTLHHLLESYDGEHKNEYIEYWDKMVNELNSENN
jgi:hypothetical protein